MEDYFNEQNMVEEAQKLNEEFDLAKNEKIKWDAKFDREEQIYMGDREFGNIYSSSTKNDSRTTVRVTETFIEAQIDLNIPDAVFKPVAKDDEKAVRKLQSEVDYTLRSGNLQEINSIAEREVKKHGITVYKVLWNNKDYGGYRGRPEIISIHPKNILWAAGCTDKNKCQCWYHVENETLQECKKRYGNAADMLPKLGERADLVYDQVGTRYLSDVNKTNDITNNPDIYSRPNEHPLAKYIIIEKWYLDEDDECCLVVFSNNCILLKKPKFYHRRKYNSDEETFEFDENGNEALLDTEIMTEDYYQEKEENGMKTNELKLPKNEEVPYYLPKGVESIPIVIQNNIPRSKAITGISDTERTYDYEQSMKKMINKHEERILHGNTKILYNKNTEEESSQLIDNDDLNIIPVNDVNGFKDFEFKDKGKEAIEFYNFLQNQLQYQMGINQVWQGANQGEARSGKAIQSLVNQTAEKIGIKVNEKNIAYKRIYRLLCDFILCFSDGNRPYRLDNTLEPEYGTFNRYEMLKKDDSGNWLYPDMDIEISAEQGFPKTKTSMMEMILTLASGGYFEANTKNQLVWQTLAKLGFPQAESILQSITTEIQNQQAMEQQALLSQNNVQGMATNEQSQLAKVINMLPEDVRKEFQSLPPEQQAAIMEGRNV